jgi:hypothetical protein
MAETEQKPARGRRVARRRRQGVACRNGYVVFVAGALPGDTVRAAINPGRVPLSMQLDTRVGARRRRGRAAAFAWQQA